MRKLKKLPSHLLHTEQAGSKFAELYAALAGLDVGGALELEIGDFDAETIERLNDVAHSATQTMQSRKGSVLRFGVRKARAEQVVYIVRKQDRGERHD